MPVIFFTGMTNKSFSQNTADLFMTSQYNIQYCNDKVNDTNVVITIGAGKILKSDSLYGFDFLIKYDTTKLFFDKPVYMSTFSENIPDKGVYFNGKNGEVRCFALNSYPFSGNLEFIGFNGVYKNASCWDSALVVFEDYELVDFTRNIKVRDSLWVVPKSRMPENYLIETKTNKDTLNFNNQNINKFYCKINNDNQIILDSLGYIITFSKNFKYRINNFKKLSDSVAIERIYEDNDKLLVKFKFNGVRFSEINIVEFEIEKLNTLNDENTYLIIEPLNLSNCDCIKHENMSSDTVYMYKKIDTVADIKEKNEYFQVDGVKFGFNINNTKNIEIQKIQLFNYEGRIVEEYVVHKNNDKLFFNVNYPGGVYILNIFTPMGIIKKSVLIYN
jgi:hypothetical protein